MDKELYELLDNMTADELMAADELLEEMAENTALPDDVTQRIRASVLKKAGLEMNNTIRMNKGNSINNTYVNEKPNTVRKGHNIIAACAAVAVLAAAAGAVIFNGRLKLDSTGSKDSRTSAVNSSLSSAVGDESAVPDVTGLAEDEAEKVLFDAGFVPEMRDIYAAGEAGIVVKTDPSPDTVLPKGSEVCFFVSRKAINFDILEQEELYETVCGLYDKVVEYHGDTIDRYNAENDSKFSVEKPSEDLSWEALRDLGINYDILISLTDDGMYDYITKSFMTETAEVPDVEGLTPEEAEQELKDAGFVPYYDGTMMTLGADGKVCLNENAGEELKKGTPIYYFVGRINDAAKAVPEYDGELYSDDDLSVKVSKLMCDGNYLILETTIEEKSEMSIREMYDEGLYYADNGEKCVYSDGAESGYNIYIYAIDSSRIGVIRSYPITPEMAERGLMIDTGSVNEHWTLVGDEYVEVENKKQRLLNIPLERNVPTKTLTSEDGRELTLSPMGISMQDKSIKKDSSFDVWPDVTYITKDGQRIDGYDYYGTDGFDVYYRDSINYVRTDSGFYWCFCGYKEIDDIEAIELNGVIYK